MPEYIDPERTRIFTDGEYSPSAYCWGQGMSR